MGFDMDKYTEDVISIAKVLHEEYGLPKSISEYLFTLDRNWFKEVDYDHLPERICKYLLAFGRITDLVPKSKANKIILEITGKECVFIPTIISVFCGVGRKTFIRELNYQELRDFNTCLNYFCDCKSEVLEKFFNSFNEELSGVDQINSALGVNLETKDINCKILEVEPSKALSYYIELSRKCELTLREESILSFARKMGYAV